LSKLGQETIFVAGSVFGSNSVPATHPTSAAGARDDGQRRPRPATSAWLPAALLGASLLLGVALWAKWGFAIAFEAIRTYCF
jgi:hypothetical protein